MNEEKRYSDEDLEEFRTIILEKLATAEQIYNSLKFTIINKDENDMADSSTTYKALEEGGSTLPKEAINRRAQEQLKLIQNLQFALKRIDNKTYGICRETGQLIPKERLRAVPHTRSSIEAKQKNKSR